MGSNLKPPTQWVDNLPLTQSFRKLSYLFNSSTHGDSHNGRQHLKTLLPKEILLILSNITFDNYVFSFKVYKYFIFDTIFDYFNFLKSHLLIQNGYQCLWVKIWAVNTFLFSILPKSAHIRHKTKIPWPCLLGCFHILSPSFYDGWRTDPPSL